MPHLAAILVGNNPASEAYVRNKVKDCEAVGFGSTLVRFDTDVTEEELLSEVAKINENDDIDGLIVQLPLPDHITSEKVTFAIRPEKDVDGFHPINVGRMAKGSTFVHRRHPSGYFTVARTLRDSHRRQTLCGHRAKRYCRYADELAYVSQGLSGQLYGHYVSQSYAEHERDHPAG